MGQLTESSPNIFSIFFAFSARASKTTWDLRVIACRLLGGASMVFACLSGVGSSYRQLAGRYCGSTVPSDVQLQRIEPPVMVGKIKDSVFPVMAVSLVYVTVIAPFAPT